VIHFSPHNKILLERDLVSVTSRHPEISEMLQKLLSKKFPALRNAFRFKVNNFIMSTLTES
jgi:hypothetical protein